MQKLTLSFLECKSPIPIVRFPLSDGKSISAIIDTGSETSVYDSSTKDCYPDMITKTKHFGKQEYIGVYETMEIDVNLSVLNLNVPRDNGEQIEFKMAAYEHQTFHLIGEKLQGREDLTDSILLLIGSDTLSYYNARIDMKNKCITFYIKKKSSR